jgi:hypothetical protein
MIQHTFRLWKCYLTKESDGVTWPPQSSVLNLIEMVWDELDCRMKSSQQVFSICGNEFKTVGKAFLVKLVEGVPRVCNTVIKAKGGFFEKSKICWFV